MKTKRILRLLVLGLSAAGTLHAQVQVPDIINYQGRISNYGTNPPGPALQFKFALVNANGSTTEWSHDGSSVNGSEPATSVTLPVGNGLFLAPLGDTAIPSMTRGIPSSAFDNRDLHLRIWVRDPNAGPAFQVLSPDQRLGSVGYSMMSANVINGAIAGNKLADGAVGTPKLTDGAVTTPKLADASITSAKVVPAAITEPLVRDGAITRPKMSSDLLALIDYGRTNTSFGNCSNCASLAIYGVSNCQPAIALDGCASEISIFNQAGGSRKMVQLEGEDANGSPALLMRGGPFHSRTTELYAYDTNTTGSYFALSSLQGHVGVEMFGSDGSRQGGKIRLFQDDGFVGVRIAGEGNPHEGGWMGIYRPGATHSPVIEFDADDSDAPGGTGLGRITTEVLEITGGADLSENFDIRSGQLGIQSGMLVCIDSETPGHLVASTRAYDPAVAGIVSGAGDVRPGMLMGQHGSLADGKHPVALTGRVYCLVDADQGAIRPGDLITTSDTPGHGMKASDPARSHGAIIGKAMTKLERSKGLVLVLVSLQ